MQLSQEQRAYFEQMEALFGMPGWKLLIDDFQGYKDALQAGIFGYDTDKSFFIAKGRAQAYDQLLHHENFLSELKQQIEEDAPSI